MIIHVKYVDIIAGRKWRDETYEKDFRCPVATAILRQSGIDTYVNLGSISERHTTQRYRCPRSVSRFVALFDNMRKVKPFRFRLVELDAKGRS